jgi:hypothetical protein
MPDKLSYSNASSIPILARVTIFTLGFLLIVLQIALTRIVSATATYHSVFIVLSIVMLGLAAAAI